MQAIACFNTMTVKLKWFSQLLSAQSYCWYWWLYSSILKLSFLVWISFCFFFIYLFICYMSKDRQLPTSIEPMTSILIGNYYWYKIFMLVIKDLHNIIKRYLISKCVQIRRWNCMNRSSQKIFVVSRKRSGCPCRHQTTSVYWRRFK